VVNNRGSSPTLKWPSEIVYQIFPDRFDCHDPAARPLPGAFDWQGRPIETGTTARRVTRRHAHQYTFFGGTLQGINRRLDYLVDLGVTAIYLTPIFKSRSTHRYDTDDYLAIDPVLGDRQDFERLTAAMRVRGLKLILDGVFNHTSFHHAWYRSRPDFYLRNRDNQPETWMGSGCLPKLNPENPDLQQQLLDVIAAWPEVNAWRLDASHLIARDFLRRLKRAVGEHRLVIGEDWDDARYDLHEGLYDGVTNFSFQRNITALMIGDCSPETLIRRLNVIHEGYPWPGVLQSWLLLNNHDTDRFFSKIGQNESAYRIAQVLQMTLPGTPLIYYGDEYGMTGWGDWEARAPMIWRPTAEQITRRQHLKSLITLRATHPILAHGAIRFHHASNQDRVLVYERYDTEHRALVMINMGPRARTFEHEGLSVSAEPQDWAIAFSQDATKHGETRSLIGAEHSV
jgi:glycosidase